MSDFTLQSGRLYKMTHAGEVTYFMNGKTVDLSDVEDITAQVVKAENERCVKLMRDELAHHEFSGDPSHIEAAEWAIKALEAKEMGEHT